jgi:hypothetical protein
MLGELRDGLSKQKSLDWQKFSGMPLLAIGVREQSPQG